MKKLMRILGGVSRRPAGNFLDTAGYDGLGRGGTGL